MSGSVMLEAPVVQSAVPEASVDTVLMTHVLVGVLAVLGMGSGGPNRQPALVQVRLVAPSSPLAAAASVRLALPVHEVTLVIEVPMSGMTAGSGTLLAPPPK